MGNIQEILEAKKRPLTDDQLRDAYSKLKAAKTPPGKASAEKVQARIHQIMAKRLEGKKRR